LPVEERGFAEADEELARGGIGILTAGHGKGSEDVRGVAELCLDASPVPVPLGQPPWIMNPSMMRWKVRPS
jgi:hypothetical protein